MNDDTSLWNVSIDWLLSHIAIALHKSDTGKALPLISELGRRARGREAEWQAKRVRNKPKPDAETE